MASILSSLSLVAGLLLVGPALLLAQRELSTGPLTAGPIADAPFSAVATTIVRRSLPNGTRIDRTATAGYFRDRLGRVRVEQALLVWDEAQPQPAERGLVTIALGDRVTMTGTDQGGGVFEIVDERWESRELGLLLESRLADSRLGTVEYRLSDIQRTEPSPDLFVVPTDYAISGLFETGKLTFVNAYNVGANTTDLWLNARK